MEAEKVWVVHKGGFSGGRMLKATPESNNTETTCKVKLDQGGEILNVDEDTIEKVWYVMWYTVVLCGVMLCGMVWCSVQV